MVQRTLAVWFVVSFLLAGAAFGQGMETNATKDNWEEINFEFNSSILSDGYPSLLRLADLLKQHPDFRVRLEGHTDSIGSARYNEKLAMARATTVKNFLVKYGATDAQVTTGGFGKNRPEVPNRSKEGRFINRRVVMTVTDGQGRVIAAGGISDVGPTLADLLKKQEECCSQILKKLDKLDDILAAVRDLKGENDRLKGDIADLKAAQDRLKQQVESTPKPLTAAETTDIAKGAAQGAVDEVQKRNQKFSLLGLNVGTTMDRSLTFTGKGRFFSPFGNGTHALQAEAEYLYYRNRQEGQFDLGLVNRFNRVQAGLFSSFKYVNMRDFGGGGVLGQGAFTFDYLFSRGRVGFFGTKGFKNEAVLSRQQLGPTSFNELYLRMVDQIGGSAQVGLWGDSYAEGNLGYLRRYGRMFGNDTLGNRPGGMIRLVQPVNERFAITFEAGLNETYLAAKDSGRFVVGFQLGNWMRPKQYLATKNPVPVDIPRIRYEVLSRRVGNSAPVADAGPDQIGAQAGTITLNGSGSYDPDGDPLKYLWEQIAGPSVSLSSTSTAVVTFTAAESQTYSFRLTVTDPGGMKSTAKTTVAISKAPKVRIARFTAQPDRINVGESSLLTWSTENAESVTITPEVGAVQNSGTQSVTPAQTTTYRITAKNRTGEVSEIVTVYVATPDVRILRFQAAPANITPGETSTLSWATDNAVSVSIPGVGDNLPANGSAVVSPTSSTTYTLVARSKDNREVTAAANVVVTAGLAPRVLNFSASPISIAPGGSTQLCWQVDNVTEVTISSLGAGLKPADCRTVSPASTTTYTLSAKNNQGQVSVSTTVSVVLPVRILTFTASPDYSQKAGDPVTLSWTTENAASVQITGTGAPTASLPASGSVVINPVTNSNYTLTAYGPAGSVSAVVHVFVR